MTPAGAVPVVSVFSSVPWHAFERAWGGELPAPLADIGASASAMTSSPIVTVNLWLQSCSLPAPYVGLVGGPMHWVFDKSAIFGEHAGHLSMVASGADDLVDQSNEIVTALAIRQLGDTLPGLQSRQLLRSVVVRERRASFSVAPGGPARPPVRTAGWTVRVVGVETGIAVSMGRVIRFGSAGPREIVAGGPRGAILELGEPRDKTAFAGLPRFRHSC